MEIIVQYPTECRQRPQQGTAFSFTSKDEHNKEFLAKNPDVN